MLTIFALKQGPRSQFSLQSKTIDITVPNIFLPLHSSLLLWFKVALVLNLQLSWLRRASDGVKYSTSEYEYEYRQKLRV